MKKYNKTIRIRNATRQYLKLIEAEAKQNGLTNADALNAYRLGEMQFLFRELAEYAPTNAMKILHREIRNIRDQNPDLLA